MISITPKGLDEVQRNLKRFPQLSGTHYANAVERGAQALRDTTKTMPPVSVARTGYDAKGIPVAPKYGGSLRQSIRTRKIALLAAGVLPGVNYGLFVHEGTRRMQARPYFKFALEDFGAQNKITDFFRQATDKIAQELGR
jgi:hypothetical protein